MENDEIIEEIDLKDDDNSSRDSKNESSSSSPTNHNVSGVIGKLFGYPKNDSDFDLNDKM